MPSESLFDEMKRYVRFDATDAGLLVRFRAFAAPHFARIAADIDEAIREREAHAVFANEDTIVRWMDRVCGGVRDAGHFDETKKIGRALVRASLPQRCIFTAVDSIRAALERVADRTMNGEAPAVRAAIARALDLELAIVLDAYREAFAGRRAIEDHDAHRVRAAIDLARVLIVGVDARANVLLFNREAERVTGFARDEVIGRPFVDAFSGEAREGEAGVEAIVARIAEGALGDDEVVDSVIRTRAGKMRDVAWQIARAPESGDAIAFFAIGRDVTDEKARAVRVRQRDRLAAVGTLAAGLAHEIRNPLNGAQLHVTLLERALRGGDADRDAREAVGVIRDEIARLSSLVTEFLDFARPRPLDRAPTSLHTLLARAVAHLSSAAKAAKVRIDCHKPTADLVLEIDPARMEQALWNLGQNAIEALAPVGGGTLVLRVRANPRHVSIDVEDDGPGLPSPDAPIFDPFYTTKPSGTGLGLSIVHRIVTDHDGSIDVRRDSKKTVFEITIPLAAPPASTGRMR